jgi:eukaryotic-like serine/threonine-protein kinase
MAEEKVSGSSIRFGPFELFLDTHELSRDGIRLKLHGQPIQVLELLVACPGRMVTRDELKRKLWPQETFGDFERGLNAAVNRLRDKLGDNAVDPIYVETVPGRGYRFIGKMEEPIPVPVPPPPAPDPHAPVWRRPLAIIMVMVVVAAVGYWWWHHHRPIPARVWVLISAFDSGGDDPLPGGMVRMVREGLTVDLQQSQYVSVFSRSQIQEILARMEKPSATQIDENTGREICLRSNLPSLLLTGSIVNRGEGFEITVQAVDPVTKVDPPLFTEDEKISKKEELPAMVDALVKRVRKDLGESAKEIKANSRPLATVTTPDFQALQLYSQAVDAREQGRVNEAQSLLLSALARDRDFAMAHHLLADVYETMGNRNEELKHLKHAYDHRARLTDRESLLVEASYDQAIQRPDDAIDVLTALVALYPLDLEAHRNLASGYRDRGDLQSAIRELKEVIKVDPHSTQTYENLVLWLARNNQPEEAIGTYRKAKADGLAETNADWGLGMALWNLGKVADAQAQFDVLRGLGSRPHATIGRIYFARTLIYQGKLAQASAQFQTGIIQDQSDHNKAPELLERYLLAAVALIQGNAAQARHHLELMVAAESPSTLEAIDLQRAGELYVQMGNIASAQQIYRTLANLSASFPSPSNSALRDNLAGEIALAQARSTDAVQLFSASLVAYPLALSHQGLARAYEAQHDWQKAAAEWKSFLNSRGEILQDFCPADWVLAHLFLARVDLHLNKVEESRDEYRKLLEIWEEGDQVGLVQQAVREAKHATG